MICEMAAETHGAKLQGEPLDMRAVIDTIPALVVCALPDGSVEFVNQGWREYTGSSLEKLTGWGWQTVIHPDDLPKFIDEWNAARAAGKAFENEARVRRADGQYRWFLISKVPLRDQTDQIVRWYGTGYDIEDRKQAEDRLRLVVDTTPALIHTGRPDGYLDYFNQRWLEYLGLSLEDVCGWRWTNLIHPEDVEGILQKWRAALASGEPFETETRVRRADGEYRWMLHRKVPVRDSRGNILKWYGSSIEIEDRKRTEEKIRQSEFYLTEGQRLAHTGSWAFNPLGFFDYWSRELFQIYGLDPFNKPPTLDEYLGLIHPEDRESMGATIQRMLAESLGCDIKKRVVRPDGEVRYIRCVGVSVVDNGILKSIVGTAIDITEQERLTQELQRREAYLAEAQKLSHTGSFGWNVCSGEIHWSPETFRIFEYEPTAKVTIELIMQRTHPEDRSAVQQLIDRVSRERTEFDFEHRLLVPDGSVKYLRVMGSPSENEDGCFEFVGAVTDITESRRAEEALRRSEGYLAEAQRLTHTGSWVWEVERRDAVHLSEEWYRTYGFDPAEGMPGWEKRLQRVHPEDRAKWQEAIEPAIREKSDYDVEYRILLPGGAVKNIHAVGHPVFSASGDLLQFVGSSTDITERKHAEERIREQEIELRQVLDLAPQHVAVLGPDGSRLFLNQSGLDYHGIALEEWRTCPYQRIFHADDAERVMSTVHKVLADGSPQECEARIRGNDGKHRWFLMRLKPIRDEQGRVTRLYSTGTDIDDRKLAEERLQHENVALREEIDKASMFEEIVGTSPALQTVLSRVSKVAPTDSTVLITGETGTGKELVARAIHRRSHRSSRAFVSVNCAAVPRDLIASELFGHEKGAFTGATQQRLGRFELAEGGTIFLDEVGELPAETQIALLRVLQEHEFERVGGTRSIQTNVRVIAATNRDLQAAIAAGSFRSDLFYRLNVFPIEIPSLRERREDIPMLVEYFIDRYARKAGKSIRGVNKMSLDLLQSYPWPGNIRELQNVIERSVIVCETENFSVDESWLSRQPLATEPKSALDLSGKLAAQEKEMIEAALRESRGRVFGPLGAAAKLGMPRSTLESKIRSLKIDKDRFKAAAPSKNN
jgi:formate hydrogenlyase transcriptional activator